jgi:lipoate-protein ligase A
MQFIVSDQTNPYLNIAVENHLVDHADSMVLYLWRNRRTVVIGQNQNPFSECDVDALEADGGFLMRRKTGGGAVYHDDGNINFSFVAPKALYDQPRQFSVIQRAVESFGLHTELSGRNDILAEGRKFSGNAFSKGRLNDLHHGTILIRGNMADLQRYLRPKPAKLLKHGVSSVRSRVVNLSELDPNITPVALILRLRQAFADIYGDNIADVAFVDISALPDVQRRYEEFASDEWKYGRWRTFTAQRSGQFDWGGIELQLTVDDGIVRDLQVATDSLDTTLADTLRKLLVGTPANNPLHALSANDFDTLDPVLRDIFSLL